MIDDANKGHTIRRRLMLEAHPTLRTLYGPSLLTLAVGVACGCAHTGLALLFSAYGVAASAGAGWCVGAWLESILFACAHDACHTLVTGSRRADSALAWVFSTPSLNPYGYYYAVFHRTHHARLGDVPPDIGHFDNDWDASRFGLYASIPGAAFHSSVSSLLSATDVGGKGWGGLGKVLSLTLALVYKTVLETRDRIGAPVFMAWQLSCDLAGIDTFVTRKVWPDDAHTWSPEARSRWESAFDADVSRIYLAVSALIADTIHKALFVAFLAAICSAWSLPLGPTLVYFAVASLSFYGAFGHPLVALWISFHTRWEPRTPDSACAPTGSMYSPVFNALTCNLGLHAEHHDFPRIPWFRLPSIAPQAPSFYPTTTTSAAPSPPAPHDNPDSIPPISSHTWSSSYTAFLTLPYTSFSYACPTQ